MTTKVSTKGQLVLPAELREKDNILPGQQFSIERIQSGEYLLKKVALSSIDPFEWLMACPEKEWFQPLPSESTDSL